MHSNAKVYLDSVRRFCPVSDGFKEDELPVPVEKRSNGYEPGDIGCSTWFPRISAYTQMEYKEVMYIVPREFVKLDILQSHNDPTILWFFCADQSYRDSFEYNPEPYIKKYLNFRPADTTQRVLPQTYALCSHRLDCLTTWNGSVEVEKSKNKKLEIGSWYQCTLNPKIVNKCCFIHQYNADPKPVLTWIQSYYCPVKKKESKLCLCRDYVEIPKRIVNRYGEENEFCSEHPLLHKIFFPKYCEFLQGVGVEICFARQEYNSCQFENKWQVVAVNTGYGMCWIPELPSSLKDIIRKEEFPFIRSLTSLEAEHYTLFSGEMSFDEVNSARAQWIKEFSSMKFDDSKKIVEKPKNDEDPKCKEKTSHATELF
uniref:Uncharacterized protein n=1 Tax=Panagrolaimus sp. PS1159 TaxID=55785 RepID=A0AC35GX13_9BILA